MYRPLKYSGTQSAGLCYGHSLRQAQFVHVYLSEAEGYDAQAVELMKKLHQMSASMADHQGHPL